MVEGGLVRDVVVVVAALVALFDQHCYLGDSSRGAVLISYGELHREVVVVDGRPSASDVAALKLLVEDPNVETPKQPTHAVFRVDV